MNANQLIAADLYGRRVAARLSEGTAGLPYEITERLRAARMQALAQRKRVAGLRTAATVSGAGAATLTADEDFSLWQMAASALPILALVAGLVFIHTIQNETRANEVAEVDAALLTDDLPPSAYADPGFIQFLKQSGNKE
ncbi:DUF3619 family protein [Ramlibacter sp. PS4R-6]|uniref:DUF3619 family protein n=1 Tax=Ramlibacter sp. PS4R-6 TaxID=3133438 RepID=UPI0030A6F0FC